MGTSTNQGSPNTPAWRAAQTAYYNAEIPTARAIQEIWRAATVAQENLGKALASPAIARVMEIAGSARSREDAIRQSSMQIALSGEASLATDLAQRALIRSFQEGAKAGASFSANLFAEASDYLVSRDLPGFIGEKGRAKNASEALEFKAQIRRNVLDSVEQIQAPSKRIRASTWAAYVETVIDQLRGARRKRS